MNRSEQSGEPVHVMVKRKFSASAEQVYDAWLNQDGAGKWLFATPDGEMQRVELDPRVGGGFVVVEKRGDQLAEHFGKYVELERPRRIVFSFSTSCDDTATLVAIEITPLAVGCELTLTHKMDPEWADYLRQTKTGWTKMLDHLATAIESERVLVITRVFNAPRHLVWDAWTKPEHVAQWWGPRGFSTRVDELDLREGGRTRYVMIGPDGTEYPGQGTFLDVIPGERFVTTDEFGEDFPLPTDQLPQGIVLRCDFEDLGPQTRLTMQIIHPTAESMQQHREMGVVAGWGSSFDCLDEFLATKVDTSDREIVIARTLNAPPELVFTAWSTPEHLARWFGPRGFSITTDSMNFQPGGRWKFVMHGPDGTDYANLVSYLEITPHQRIVYQQGNGEDHPDMFFVTVTFEDRGGKTRLNMKLIFPTAEERERVSREVGAVDGGRQTVGRLADYLTEMTGEANRSLTLMLPSEREFRMARTFNAPRELVWEAISKPEHVRNWWGCAAFEVLECEMDFRPGGAWKITQRSPDGGVHPFKGEYREITPVERVVQTFIYDVEMIRDHVALETMNLTEENGKTLLTVNVQHDSVESRNGHLYSGMEGGAAESYNRLEALLEKMQG